MTDVLLGRAAVDLVANTASFIRDMNAASRKFEEVGSRMQSIGSSLSASVTLPILGIGGAAAKAFTDFETALTGVAKTVDAPAATIEALGERFKGLSEEIPVAANELLRIAELGGQLGIATGSLEGFVETIAALGVSTNLSTEEAATSFARLANILGTSQDDFDRLGSVVVDLGNNLATTEREIVMFAERMAGAGKIAGLTEGDVLAIGAAMSSVGVEAEAGGTAVQKVLLDLNDAVTRGGDSLETFARTAGMTSSDFAATWRADAGSAFAAFVSGLGQAGDNATQILADLGLENARTTRAFLSLANAGPLLTEAIERGSRAWEENTALSEEAARFYDRLGADFGRFANKARNVASELGQALAPAFAALLEKGNALLDWARNAIERFAALPPSVRVSVAAFAGLAASVGPLLVVLGGLVKTLGAIGALSIAGAVLGWARAFAGLAVSVRSVSDALTLLKVAIGPGGWLLLGASAVAAAFLLMKRRAAEATESVADFQHRLDMLDPGGVDTEIQRLTRELDNLLSTVRAAGGLEFVNKATLDRLDEVKEKLRLAGEARAEALGPGEDELADEAKAVEEAIRKALEAAGLLGDEFDSLADLIEDAADQADLLVRAFDAGLVTTAQDFAGLLTEIASEEDRLRAVLADQTATLEDQVLAAEALLRLAEERGRITSEFVGPAPDALLEQGKTKLGFELEPLKLDAKALLPVTRAVEGAFREWIVYGRDLEASVFDLADAIGPALSGISGLIDAFDLLDDRVAGAIRGIGQIASGISAFGRASELEGITKVVGQLGAVGSIIAGGVSLFDSLFGGADEEEQRLRELQRERDRYLESLRREARLVGAVDNARERLASDALGGIFDAIEDFADTNQIQSVFRPTDVPLDPNAIRAWLEDALDGAMGQIKIRDPGLREAWRLLIEGLIDDLDALEEELAQQRKAFGDSLELRRLEALGQEDAAEALRIRLRYEEELARAMDLADPALVALVREVYRLEEAARMAARAQEILSDVFGNIERRSAPQDLGEIDFFGQVAGTWDQIRDLFSRDLLPEDVTREFLSDIEAINEALAEGVIDPMEAARLLTIIWQQAGDAAEDYAESVRMAAEAAEAAARAEEFRAAQDLRSLQVRLLLAQGLDAEAQAMRQQIELLQAIEDGRSGEYIALLQQVQAAERAAQARQKETRELERTERAMNSVVRALNAPQGLRLSLLRWRSLAEDVPGSSSAVQTRDPASFIQPPSSDTAGPGGGESLSFTIENVNLTSSSGESGEELLAKLQKAATRSVRRGGADPLRRRRS